MSIFGDLRKAAGLTQVQIAHMAGVTPRQAQRWEAGHSRVPKLVQEMLERLALERQ